MTSYDLTIWLSLIGWVALLTALWVLVYQLTKWLLARLVPTLPHPPELKSNCTKYANKPADNPHYHKSITCWLLRYLEIFKHIFRTTTLNQNKKHPVNNSCWCRDHESTSNEVNEALRGHDSLYNNNQPKITHDKG